jgi:thioredoxin reductase (NADPH)
MNAAPETDAIIIGAGPAGLFAAFQLGLFGFQSALIDTLAGAGGQCRALYADKPVFDLPGFPRIDAGEFVEQLLVQIQPFSPAFPIRSEGRLDPAGRVARLHRHHV